MTTYTGTNGSDTINGSTGDDTISGGNGNDTLNGGSGNDTISGGNGNDTIDGGDNDDTISGGNGNDVILGGAGNDNLTGDNGNDDFTGGAGDDVIDGSNGFDTARYSGLIGEYSFFSAGGYLHVVHLGGAGADGHDQLKRVERLIFADRVIDLTGGTNNAPVAGDDHVFINEDTGTYSSGAGSVKDNDFDFEGQPLTVTGGTFTGTYGTLTLNSDGTYSYTLFASAQALDDGENVQDSFNYTISDGTGSDTGTLVFHIAGLNDAPVANDDSASTTEDAAVSGNVLANDTDVDVEPLIVANPGTYVGAHGTLVLAADGSYTYTPNAGAQALDDGEVVSDSFSYTASDGTASDTATLTIDVHGANDAPVANDDSASTTEETGVSGNVLANDTDVDVEPLTVANPGTYVGTYGTLILAADGSYTYTPNAAAQGLDTGETAQDVFTYAASDGTASDSATLTVSVTGLNDAPVANDDTASTFENASVSGNVLANDTDVDGETLTVTNPATYIGAYGTLVLAANGSYTYTPSGAAEALNDGQVVNDVFNYIVSDGTASDAGTLTITITGLSGVPNAHDDTASTTEDASVSGNVLTNDTDPEGDTLSVANPGTYVGTYGTLTLGANGSYNYAPNATANGLAAGEVGQDVFTYTATDGSGSDTATLTVTVNGTNDAPTIDAGGTDASGSVSELPDGDSGENVTVHSDSGAIAFDDVDVSDTHSASFTPQGGGYLGTFSLDPVDDMGDTVGWDFSVSDAALEGLSEGEVRTQTYTVQIDDGHGGTATQNVTITITGAGVGVGPQSVWYIDNSAVGSANTGTQADPFTSIAAFNAAQGNLGGPQAGHTVYLLAGTGTYAETDGINLLDGQVLVGVADGALRPTITATGGDGIDLAQNNNVTGIDIGSTSGAGISDSGGSVGSVTISDVGKSGTGQIVDIDQGGTLNITLNSATSLGSSGGAIDLAGVGGSFTITGATTITGIHSGGGIDITGSSLTASFDGGGNVATLTTTAVNFVGNSGALALGGGLDIVTTSGAGLNATGGGTITFTGADNSITSTTGTAVTISGTAIGAAGVTLESVSANGAVNGIVLNGTGSSGFFTVTGDGSQTAGLYDRDGSGGTIQNTSQDAISLTNASNVTIRQMNITNAGWDGVDSRGGGNITLSAVDINHPGNANPLANGSTGNPSGFGGGNGWYAQDITGVNGFDNNSRVFNWQSALSNGVVVNNNNTNFTSFTVDHALFSTSATGGAGFNVNMNGTSSGSVNLTDSELTLIDQNGAQILNNGTGTVNAVIQRNNFHDADATGGDGNNTLLLVNAGGGLLNFRIGGTNPADGNVFHNLARLSALAGVVQVNSAGGNAGTGPGSINGFIQHNTIDNSAGFVNGRRGIDIGVEADAHNLGSIKVDISDNAINNVAKQGINILVTSVGGGSITDANFTITGNHVGDTSSVGTDGNVDSGSAIELETNFDNFNSGADIVVNALLQNNVFVNNNSSGTGDTLDMTNRGGNPGTSSVMNLTILGNSFTNLNGAGKAFDIMSSSSGSDGTVNLDLNSANTDPNNTTIGGSTLGEFQIRQLGGTFNIENLGANAPGAFVSARNNGDNVTVAGTIGSTGPVTMPTAPSSFIMSGHEAAGPSHAVGHDNILDQAALDQLANAAIQRWADAGATADQLAAMHAVSVTVSDIAGSGLGASTPGHIALDSDGGGYGWFIDATPGDDGEFAGSGAHLIAAAGGAADGLMDALTVIMHELGHQIGLDDDYGAGGHDALMFGTIDPGERRLPDGLFETETGVSRADLVHGLEPQLLRLELPPHLDFPM